MSSILRRTWDSFINFFNKICHRTVTDRAIERKNKIVYKNEIVKQIKRKRKRREKCEYSKEIHLLLKRIDPNLQITSSGMNVMNCLVKDLFDKIASQASQLSHNSKRKTILVRDIESSVKLIFPKEMSKKANEKGMKAITCYKNSL